MEDSANKGIPSGEIISVPLVQDQARIAGYLDGLNAVLKQYKVRPSSFLEGAAFLCNPELRNNPDWIAQAAHSLREVGYLLSGPPTRRNSKRKLLIFSLPLLRRIFISAPRSKKIEEIVRIYLEEAEAAALSARIADMTHLFAEISHHHAGTNGDQRNAIKKLIKLGIAKSGDTVVTGDVFIELAKEFLRTILATTTAYLTLHQKIDLACDEICKNKGDKKYLSFLLASNGDSRAYFFSKVPIECFDWLRREGFFDIVKQVSNENGQIRYRTPELDYLVRVAEIEPKKVVDFMLTYDSRSCPNIETIDRFLWIVSKLPAEQLSRMVTKIRDEQWVVLMGNFNHWGFEYKQMFDTLVAAKDFENIVTLAEAVLSVRPTENVNRTAFGSIENPFYFSDLHYSEVFERLCEVDGVCAERAFKLVLKTLSDVVLLSRDKEDEVFEIGDMYSLFDVDFFTLTVQHERHLSSRDDVRDLAAVAKFFVKKLLGGVCDDPVTLRHLYNTHIVPLPDARSMWRFRLYVWSLCPVQFTSELRDAFFRGLESEKTLWPITGGAEYEQALISGFTNLADTDKSNYIRRAFELFESMGKEHPYGYGIFSSIYPHLSDSERQRAEVLYKYPLKKDFSPTPSVGQIISGTVVPQAPQDDEGEWNKTTPEIVEFLKTKWSPEGLSKTNAGHDFLRPINAEGVGRKLQEQTKARLSEYVASAPLFFDRDKLDAHYTYTFLRGLQEVVHDDRKRAQSIDWSPVIGMAINIVESGSTTPFDTKREREKSDSWLSGWTGVHSNLSDLIKELLRGEGESVVIDLAQHRDDLFRIVGYLFSYPDPSPADEKIETATMKTLESSTNEYQVSDPLSMAINTTRGRAFETFVYFVQEDSKKFSKDAGEKLSNDVRVLYEKVLSNEDTRAIMFMFGHYISFFYYRDHDWMRKKIFPVLFSSDPEKHDLRLAAWEGYLCASLYDELFKQLHDEYVWAIALNPATYTKRRYRGELDEALATHLALAYIHFDEFGFDSDLYKSFWNNENPRRWGTFVSFVGRSVISRDQPKMWLKEHPEVKINKLEEFWDWTLKHCSNKDVLAEFGFWIQVKDDIFDPIWLADHVNQTLEKTGGDLNWEIGFIDSLPVLARSSPEKTLNAIRKHLIDGSILKSARGYIHVDRNLIDVLKTLYQNASTRDGTYKLINDLLPIGNGHFWGLREVLE